MTVTVLNWTTATEEKPAHTIRAPFAVAGVRSVRHGELRCTISGKDRVSMTLPCLEEADIVVLSPAEIRREP